MVSDENKYIIFKEFGVSHPVSPYAILDFEAAAIDYNDTSESKTKKLKKFQANSYGLYCKLYDQSQNFYFTKESNNEIELLDSLVLYLKQLPKMFHKLINISNDKFDWDKNDPNALLYQQKYETLEIVVNYYLICYP